MKFTWKQIHNEIDIEAGPELVWEVLFEVSDYRNWNPFLVQVVGQARVGSYLDLTMSPPGASPRQKKVLITSLKSSHEFSWKGTKGLTVFLSGYNRFRFIPLSGHKTRLIQEETFSGVLVPFCATWLDEHLAAGYKNMLIALKSEVEKRIHN